MTSSNKLIKQKKHWLPIVMAASPALVFFALILNTSFDLPIVDDYYAILNFVNNYSQKKDIVDKINYVVSYQHNEYKLILGSLIYALQYELMGKINFQHLSIIGSLFVIPLYFFLANNLKIENQKLIDQLFNYISVAFLVFQLQYASTLNFSMAALQNVTVLVFALGSINLLVKGSCRSFVGACLTKILAITASGSGFILAPVGIWLLIERKRWNHVFIWLITTILVSIIYFYKYSFSLSHAEPVRVSFDFENLLHLFNMLGYMLTFLGASIARYQGYGPSIVLGFILLIVWVIALFRGYSIKNPTVFYFAMFLIATAVGVTMIRSNFGMEQALASRYRIYSNLLLVLAYIYYVEEYQRNINGPWLKKILSGLVGVATLAFFTLSNIAGYKFLDGRRQAVEIEMNYWQKVNYCTPDKLSNQTKFDPDPVVRRQIESGLFKPITNILNTSIALGIYYPKCK